MGIKLMRRSTGRWFEWWRTGVRRTLDREVGDGRDRPKPRLPVLMVDAVPIGADGRVAGRCCCRSRHGVRQDARTGWKSFEDHSIQLGGEGDQPVGDVVDGGDFGGEVGDGGVDAGLPRHESGGRLLHQLEAVAQRSLQTVDARLHQGESVAQLLHLIEEELRVGIHGSEEFLETGVVGVGIQIGRRIESLIPDDSTEIESG